MYHYPYQNDDSQVRKVLSHFGLVEDISNQSWVSLKGVHTGTRIVRMVLTSHIPLSLMIDGLQDLVQRLAGDLRCLQGGWPRSR